MFVTAINKHQILQIYCGQKPFAESTIASLNQSLQFRLMRDHDILDLRQIASLEVRKLWQRSPFADQTWRPGNIFSALWFTGRSVAKPLQTSRGYIYSHKWILLYLLAYKISITCFFVVNCENTPTLPLSTHFKQMFHFVFISAILECFQH